MFKRTLPALLAVIVFAASAAFAQGDDPAAMKARAKTLVDALKLTEALPLYEKLAELTPKDGEVHFYLAMSLLAQAQNTGDAAAARQMRIRARSEFIKARDLGNDSIALKGYIEGIPEDGSAGPGFSSNAEANKLMNEAEAAFSSGRLDDALANYQAALKIDPSCYHAALFSGDVFTQKGNFADALAWYQKAIAIDPFRETGYRYSATPLMKQKKYAEAKAFYIESYIRAPYDKLAIGGVVQWAQATNTPVSHPQLDVPEITIGPDGKANTKISVTPSDDGSMAWMAYVTTREDWKSTKFARAHPKEQYRHTVAEEVDALRSVVSMAHSLKPKRMNPQIALLEQMDKDGVLDAYILLARPDQTIAHEHAAYVRSNPDKLRLYVTKYVIGTK